MTADPDVTLLEIQLAGSARRPIPRDRSWNVFRGGRSEIKPSEVSPVAYRDWCRGLGIDPDTMREREEAPMTEPKIAAKKPAAVQLEAGKTYAWCACGLSQSQPFCDGSHKTTELRPVVFKAEKTETAYLCQCKRSRSKPFCDGTHKSL